MEQLETIQAYLGTIGVEPEATSVYVELFKLGPASALQISRQAKISRTQTYRHLEALQNVGLVSAEQLSYGTLFRALPIENIEGIIANREAETNLLRGSLSDMTELLQQIAGSTGPKATTQHYYGLAGLKQANWNLTKAKDEYRVFEAAHVSEHFDKAFAQRLRERTIERGLTSYDLTNRTSIKAAEIAPFNPARTKIRHIDPKTLTIQFEVYIYNDVVTLLDYDQKHALEIHHPTLHLMMRQLFDAMWNMATPVEIGD